MANINDMYPSKYIKASDLKGNEWPLVIDRIENEEINEGKFKPVLYFRKAAKGLVMNRTNAMTIASYYGPETEGWFGKEVILYPVKVPFQNQMTDAIRIRALPQRAIAQRTSPQRPVNPAEAVGFEDQSENPAPRRGPAAAGKTSIADDDIPFAPETR